jgi:hypothetical protein
MRQSIHENLKNCAHAPSVQLQNVPPSFFDSDQIAQDEVLPDVCQDNIMMSSERYNPQFYTFVFLLQN